MKYTRNVLRDELDLGRTLDGGRMWARLHLRYAPSGNKPEGVPELAISFQYCPKGSRKNGPGNSYGQCGEAGGGFPKENKLARTVIFLWRGYHLNAMQAGCQHQRAAGWTSYDEHPSEACPVCGYKYGTKWLIALLPMDVEQLARQIIETGKVPD